MKSNRARHAGVVMTLTLWTAVACTREQPPTIEVAVAQAEPAGAVVSLHGVVTARRSQPDASERQLSAGDGIWADDTVTTSGDATVAIRLAHNGAIWTLAGGKRKRVDQAGAWRAPKQALDEALAGKVQQSVTVSAGRHSEQEAASSAEAASRRAPPRQASAPEPRTARPKRAERKRAAPPPAADQPVAAAAGAEIAQDEVAAAAPPLPPGSSPWGDKKAGGSDPTEEAGHAVDHPVAQVAPAKPAMTPDFVAVKGARERAAVIQALRNQLGPVRRCYLAQLEGTPQLQGELHAIVAFGPDGAVRQVALDGGGLTDAGLRRCAAARLKDLRLPAVSEAEVDGRTLVKLKLDFQPR